MEHLQPEVLIPSLPPLYTCSIFSDYHILLPILHYESGIICSKETVTLTIFYFDNLMHCSYSLTVDFFLLTVARQKPCLSFSFWYYPQLAYTGSVLFAWHYQKRSMAKLKPKALLAQSKVKKGPSQISAITIFTYLVLGVVVVSSVYAAYKYWVGKGPEVTAAGVEGN